MSSFHLEFDVIGVSETWLTDDTVDNYNIPGYNLYYSNRQEARGGGVAVFVKTELKCKECKNLEFNNSYCNTKFIEIEMADSKNIIIGVIYRAPSSNPNFYFTLFNELLNKLILLNHKLLFLMGDFNFDLLKLGQDTNVNKFLDFNLSSFLYPLISCPTRI